MTHPVEANLSADDVTARARAAYDAGGRLPLGEVTGWDIFPFDGDLRVAALADPVVPEPDRSGVDPATCHICTTADSDYIWTNDTWRVRPAAHEPSLPIFMLEPRAHVDIGGLNDDMAAELGRLMVRLERAIESVVGVGRVHIYRWGDGAVHLHFWFFARPAGMMQLRGMMLPLWEDALPALPTETWQTIIDHVAGSLAASSS